MASGKRVNREEEEEGDNSPIHEEKRVKIDEEEVGGGRNDATVEHILREFNARREKKRMMGIPDGYVFSPNDVEIVDHILKNKILGEPLPCHVITEIDLKADPDELPVDEFKLDKKYVAYFFTNLDREYTKGQLPSRTTKSGYWKATGNDVPVFSNNVVVGFKKIFVFYSGEAPCGEKTCWVMHEFRVNPSNIPVDATDDSIMAKIGRYVLCKIQKKNVVNEGWSSD